MNGGERTRARATLVRGRNIKQLIKQLEGNAYANLVAEHATEFQGKLVAMIRDHNSLYEPNEVEYAGPVLQNHLQEADNPTFWAKSSADVLTSVSCDLNDEMFPERPDVACIYNTFQMHILLSAERWNTDAAFKRLVTANARSQEAKPGRRTERLDAAISEHNRGALDKARMLQIFQEAVDNGDILLEANQLAVVAHVLPLLDAGILKPSKHVSAFGQQMDTLMRDAVASMRGGTAPKKWWKFWN
jgi:hypothetical protein